MIIFLTGLFISALVAFAMLIASRIIDDRLFKFSLKEYFLSVGVMLVISAIAGGITSWRNTSDIEVISGVIYDKKSTRVSCEHDYCCGWCTRTSCTSNSKGGTTCSTSTYCCRTCYEHSFDVNWSYHVDWGKKEGRSMGLISRVDRQGLVMPPRWSQVRVGEAAYKNNSYDNYIKAAPGSLFNRSEDSVPQQVLDSIHEEPTKVFDYYRTSRYVPVGFVDSRVAEWQKQIDQTNIDVGARKEVTVTVVVAMDKPESWFYALRRKWLGGKKNSFVVVIGVDRDMKPTWARVMTWDKTHMAQVLVQNSVLEMKKIEPKPVMAVVTEAIDKHRDRLPMKTFEYLMSASSPEPWQYVVSVILMLIGLVVTLFLCWTNDIFDDEYYE